MGNANGVRNDLWVFGYGSLLWRTGFSYAEAVPARLDGWHRAPCVLSHVHRGTPERPGVVLGLDQGGSCDGLAFRVPDMGRVKVLDYLRGREQVTMVYQERVLPVTLRDGRRVEAVTYTVDRTHAQYAHSLPLSELVERIEGRKGPVRGEPGLFPRHGREVGRDGHPRRPRRADRRKARLAGTSRTETSRQGTGQLRSATTAARSPSVSDRRWT